MIYPPKDEASRRLAMILQFALKTQPVLLIEIISFYLKIYHAGAVVKNVQIRDFVFFSFDFTNHRYE